MISNEQSIEEIIGYRNQTIITASVLLFMIGLALFLSFFCAVDFLVEPLLGAFLGVFFSTLNAFALGYAYFGLVLKGTARRVILWPIASFLFMCAAALVLVMSFSPLLLGFALGLTAPLIFGATIVLSLPRPA